MANIQNLIPITSKAQARELGRKGGKVRSPRKKYASRLRELKKKGLTNSVIKRITDILEEPESSILDIKLLLDSFRPGISIDPGIKLANAYIKLHQAHHGQKHKIEGELNQNINPIEIIINYPDKNGKSNNRKTENKLESNRKAN